MTIYPLPPYLSLLAACAPGFHLLPPNYNYSRPSTRLTAFCLAKPRPLGAPPLNLAEPPNLWVVSGSSTPSSSTPDSLTPSSSTILALQLLIAGDKQFRGSSGGQSPPVLAFSLRVWGIVSREYDVLVFSV